MIREDDLAFLEHHGVKGMRWGKRTTKQGAKKVIPWGKRPQSKKW